MSIRGLDIALGALAAQQRAIDVLNHNIANANTPGYSRQRVHMVALPAFLISAATGSVARRQAGNGVEVDSVYRVRDAFIEAQYWNESRSLEEARVLQSTYDQLQAIFAEPSDTGLNHALGRFWGAWHDLSANPSDEAARASVVQQGISLSGLLRQSSMQLSDLRANLTSEASSEVEQVNDLARSLAALNGAIQRAQLSGGKANDLLDQRDELVQSLQQIIKVQAIFNEDDTVDLYLGGQELVHGIRSRSFEVFVDAAAAVHVQWEDTSEEITPAGGRLLGVLDSVNTVVTGKLAELDAIALQLRDDVNSVHRTGFDRLGNTGQDFFAGTGAANLAVDAAIQSDPQAIAAAGRPNAPGDGAIALAIARLGHSTVQLGGANELAAGSVLPLSGATVQRVLLEGANPSTTYQLTSTAPGRLTLSATIGGVLMSQDLDVAAMQAGETQELDFAQLGVRIVLRSAAAAAPADIVADLTDPARDEIAAASRTTIEEGYNRMVVRLGIDARSVDGSVANGESLVNNLERRRASISGVSLDEEAADLVRYLRAYQAAARVITAMDEMLDTIIRAMGAGR